MLGLPSPTEGVLWPAQPARWGLLVAPATCPLITHALWLAALPTRAVVFAKLPLREASQLDLMTAADSWRSKLLVECSRGECWALSQGYLSQTDQKSPEPTQEPDHMVTSTTAEVEGAPQV